MGRDPSRHHACSVLAFQTQEACFAGLGCWHDLSRKQVAQASHRGRQAIAAIRNRRTPALAGEDIWATQTGEPPAGTRGTANLCPRRFPGHVHSACRGSAGNWSWATRTLRSCGILDAAASPDVQKVGCPMIRAPGQSTCRLNMRPPLERSPWHRIDVGQREAVFSRGWAGQSTNFANLEFSQLGKHNRKNELADRWVGRAVGDPPPSEEVVAVLPPLD